MTKTVQLWACLGLCIFSVVFSVAWYETGAWYYLLCSCAAYGLYGVVSNEGVQE